MVNKNVNFLYISNLISFVLPALGVIIVLFLCFIFTPDIVFASSVIFLPAAAGGIFFFLTSIVLIIFNKNSSAYVLTIYCFLFYGLLILFFNMNMPYAIFIVFPLGIILYFIIFFKLYKKEKEQCRVV